jgi:hypothetical protein
MEHFRDRPMAPKAVPKRQFVPETAILSYEFTTTSATGFEPV